MKPQYEQVTITEQESSLKIIKLEQPRFDDYWHYHPELELTWIVKGQGIRFVGDHVGTFSEGDLVMTGNNIPHNWVSSSESKGIQKGFVCQFSLELFHHFAEAKYLQLLFHKASFGISFPDFPETKKKILSQLLSKPPILRIALLLELLHYLSESHSQQLSSISFERKTSLNKHQDRMTMVRTYVLEHLHETVSLNTISEQVMMTPTSFSRWFKHIAGQSFVDYLSTTRIERACEILLLSHQPISQVAFTVGFESISSFNRSFKKIKGVAPREYRQRR